MWARVIVFAALASAASADRPGPKLKNVAKKMNATKLGDMFDEPEYFEFPSTEKGAAPEVRRALCPKQIQITGISKRALGCTIGDIFGKPELSDQYIAKLKRWAKDVSAKNPAFQPSIHMNEKALANAGIDKIEAEAKNDEPDGTEVVFEGVAGTVAYTPQETVPDEAKPWEKKEPQESPDQELFEEEESAAEAVEEPGPVIEKEKLPWTYHGEEEEEKKGKKKAKKEEEEAEPTLEPPTDTLTEEEKPWSAKYVAPDKKKK